MDSQELKLTLQKLHEQIERGETIDPEVRLMLQQLSQDVQAVSTPSTGQLPAMISERSTEHQTLLDRILSVTDDFEESHPDLAHALGNVAGALSRMGI